MVSGRAYSIRGGGVSSTHAIPDGLSSERWGTALLDVTPVLGRRTGAGVKCRTEGFSDVASFQDLSLICDVRQRVLLES